MIAESEIYERLTEIFHEVFDDDEIVLGPQTTAADIEEWDSFNQINILVAVESRFGIELDTTEAETMKDVGEFVELIQRKSG